MRVRKRKREESFSVYVCKVWDAREAEGLQKIVERDTLESVSYQGVIVIVFRTLAAIFVCYTIFQGSGN